MLTEAIARTLRLKTTSLLAPERGQGVAEIATAALEIIMNPRFMRVLASGARLAPAGNELGISQCMRRA